MERQIIAWSMSTVAQVEGYCRLFPCEREQLEPLFSALASGEDIHSRGNPKRHLAASGVVISEGRLLTIYHPHLRRWLQPGGHLEGHERPEEAALREILEETGASAHLHLWHAVHRFPIDLGVHMIPANPVRQEPEHIHFDFRYLMTCSFAGHGNAELQTRWSAQADLDESGLHTLMDKLRALRILCSH